MGWVVGAVRAARGRSARAVMGQDGGRRRGWFEWWDGSRAVAWAGGGLLAVLVLPGQVLPQHREVSERTVIGANVLVGGTVSGVVAFVRGKPVLAAIANGTAGGLGIYGGKRLAGARAHPVLGLGGRIVASVGASMIRNGAAGRRPFELVALPLGPLTLYHGAAGDSAHAPVKVHLLRTVVLAALIRHESARVDWRETLYLGAPVFYTPDRLVREGRTRVILGASFAGAILVSDPGLLSERRHARLMIHERVHVLQDHQVEVSITGPVENALLRAIPGGAWLSRYVDLGAVHAAAVVPMLSAVPYSSSPWEIEAEHFAGRR